MLFSGLYVHVYPKGRAWSRALGIIFSLLLIMTLAPLPAGAPAGASPADSSVAASTSAPSAMPVVTGAELTLENNVFSEGGGGGEAREQSFKGDLTLPKGANDAAFTSDPTRAPLDFSDVAPHWWT